MVDTWDIAFWSLFATIAVTMLLLHLLVRMVRKRHPKEYEALGFDHMMSKGGYADFYRFFWKREYRRLRDPDVTALCGFLRVLVFAYTLGFFAMLAWSIIDDLRGHGDAAVADASTAPQAPRDAAYELHRAGRVAEAAAAYDAILGETGNDAEMIYYRGNARASLARYDEALADYRRVMDLAPAKFEAYLNADRILSRQRRFDDCVDLWTRYLRVVPNDATAYMERGGSHFHRGDFAAAHADAARACELGKQEACAHAERMKARL